MTVTLENVTRSVDGIATIRDVSLTLARGTLSVLLGPTLAGRPRSCVGAAHGKSSAS